jgi:uncharacterized membrane protein
MASSWKRKAPWALAGLLGGMGVLHFVAPKPFVKIVPKALPNPEFLVAVSGVAELACAALVAAPQTRRLGGISSVALFLAVFPANVQMALDAREGPAWYRNGCYARLPLQAALIAWALQVSKD